MTWLLMDAWQIVQARMWAQGLTVGVLIAAGELTHAQRQKAIDGGPLHHAVVDHSWRDIVEHEQAAAEGRQVAQRVPWYY